MALVRQLAQQGFHVLLGSRNKQAGQQAAKTLQSEKGAVDVIALDVTSPASIANAAYQVEMKYGKLDVLMNNAGVCLKEDQALFQSNGEVMQSTMNTNFLGVFHVTKAFLPLMQKQDYGRIINISSEYGAASAMDSTGLAAYKLSKFTLNGLTRLAAVEVTGNIKINAVDPGWVSSDMGGSAAPKTPEQAAKEIIWLATMAEDGPSGRFFLDGREVEW